MIRINAPEVFFVCIASSDEWKNERDRRGTSGKGSHASDNGLRCRATGVLPRRSVSVPGILATHRPGTITDKSGRRYVSFRLEASGSAYP
jgi:hypothetical protein